MHKGTRVGLAGVGLVLAALGLAVCSGTSEAPPPEAAPPVAPKAPFVMPAAVQDPLVGGPFPAVVLSQAWFLKDDAGKPVPGPARLEIWRDTPDGWKSSRLEDPDSNVFHKTVFYDGGLVTIAGEKAMLKKWHFADGAWKQDTLWQKDFGGKFSRLRDLEIGDVDGDGKDEFVMATHDQGEIVVYNPDEPTNVFELDKAPDTIVHEIEIGDIDGDGKSEFFATPSGRNTANASQSGALVMYRWDGKAYQRTVVEQFTTTHAKECLAADIDGDGKAELFAVMEAEIGPDKAIKTPVTIRQYKLQKDGTFAHADVATIDDRQTRFLVPADIDGDGTIELIASAFSSGVWVLEPNKDGTWTPSNIDRNTGGFEHAAFVTDLDGDGKPEIYASADDQQQLKRYAYNATTKRYDITLVGKLAPSTFTWNLAAGKL